MIGLIIITQQAHVMAGWATPPAGGRAAPVALPPLPVALDIPAMQARLVAMDPQLRDTIAEAAMILGGHYEERVLERPEVAARAHISWLQHDLAELQALCDAEIVVQAQNPALVIAGQALLQALIVQVNQLTLLNLQIVAYCQQAHAQAGAPAIVAVQRILVF